MRRQKDQIASLVSGLPQTTKQTEAPAAGKKDIVRMSVYLDRDLHGIVMSKLYARGERQTFTDLIEQYLRQWVLRG